MCFSVILINWTCQDLNFVYLYQPHMFISVWPFDYHDTQSEKMVQRNYSLSVVVIKAIDIDGDINVSDIVCGSEILYYSNHYRVMLPQTLPNKSKYVTTLLLLSNSADCIGSYIADIWVPVSKPNIALMLFR